MLDKLNAQQISIFEAIASKARGLLEEEGHVEAASFFITGTKAVFMPLDMAKSVSTDTLKEVLDEIQPEMVLTVMTAWMLTGREGEYALMEGFSPELYPSKENVISFAIQTPEGNLYAYAPILNRAGQNTFDELTWVDADSVVIGG